VDRWQKRSGKPPFYLNLPPGDYFVVAVTKGNRFHEVDRRVPPEDEEPMGVYPHQQWALEPDGTISLVPISIPLATVADDMVLFTEKKDFAMGTRQLPDTPVHHRRVPAFRLDRREQTFADFDRVNYGTRPMVSNATAQSPLSMIGYDQARALAEMLGKRFPSEAEYEVAASPTGSFLGAFRRRHPSGDWSIEPADEAHYDRTRAPLR
jgi:hypothetical protein